MVAKFAGLEVECVSIEMGKQNKTPEYLQKFPLGKVPAFEGADGYLLTESTAICLYCKSRGVFLAGGASSLLPVSAARVSRC